MFCCRNEKFSLHISFRHHHLTHIFISTGIEEAKEKQSQWCYGGIVIHMLTELMKGGKFNWRDFPRKKKSFFFLFFKHAVHSLKSNRARWWKKMWHSCEPSHVSLSSRLPVISGRHYQPIPASAPSNTAIDVGGKKWFFFMFSKKIDIWFKYLKMEWKKKSVFRLQFLSYTDTAEAQPIVLQSHKHTRNGILMCYLMWAALRGYPKCNQLGRKFCSQLS